MKEKIFRIEFSAVINGFQDIEAIDEEDAREQFCVDSISDFNDDQFNAEIDDVYIVNKNGKKKNDT